VPSDTMISDGASRKPPGRRYRAQSKRGPFRCQSKRRRQVPSRRTAQFTGESTGCLSCQANTFSARCAVTLDSGGRLLGAGLGLSSMATRSGSSASRTGVGRRRRGCHWLSAETGGVAASASTDSIAWRTPSTIRPSVSQPWTWVGKCPAGQAQPIWRSGLMAPQRPMRCKWTSRGSVGLITIPLRRAATADSSNDPDAHLRWCPLSPSDERPTRWPARVRFDVLKAMRHWADHVAGAVSAITAPPALQRVVSDSLQRHAIRFSIASTCPRDVTAYHLRRR